MILAHPIICSDFLSADPAPLYGRDRFSTKQILIICWATFKWHVVPSHQHTRYSTVPPFYWQKCFSCSVFWGGGGGSCVCLSFVRVCVCACACRVEREAGLCADGKDAPLIYWTRRGAGVSKTRLQRLKDLAFLFSPFFPSETGDMRFRDTCQQHHTHPEAARAATRGCVFLTMHARLSLL